MKTTKNFTRQELLRRIWIDPERCFGKPCIRGHRIWVSLILDMLASGLTARELSAVGTGGHPRLPCLWRGNVA